MVLRTPMTQGPGERAGMRETPSTTRQPEIREIKQASDDDWREFDREGSSHVRPHFSQEFDVVAWFALKDQHDANCPMTECWYG